MTRNIIFGFALCCLNLLNFDLNAVNLLKKLNKYIKCIEAKFSIWLFQEGETEEFNQI